MVGFVGVRLLRLAGPSGGRYNPASDGEALPASGCYNRRGRGVKRSRLQTGTIPGTRWPRRHTFRHGNLGQDRCRRRRTIEHAGGLCCMLRLHARPGGVPKWSLTPMACDFGRGRPKRGGGVFARSAVWVAGEATTPCAFAASKRTGLVVMWAKLLGDEVHDPP